MTARVGEPGAVDSEMVDYEVRMLAEPGLPLRILNQFAQRGLLIDRLGLSRHGDMQRLTIHATALPSGMAASIAAKLDAMIGVTSVTCMVSDDRQ